MTDTATLTLGVILITASLVAIVSRRLHLPYSVGLVVAGIGLALSPLNVNLPLSRDLIFSVFLPPLVFEAALQIDWTRFRRELPLTGSLAFIGVCVASLCVAAGAHWLLGWSWLGAGLFGVLIAATDPVSVIAAFREMCAEPRLALIVESESLLNDGAAAVGFAVLAAVAEGMAPSAVGAAGFLLLSVFGGVACGAVIAGAVLVVAGRTDDHLVEITLTTVAAYASFLIAEQSHLSGVLATLTAGLLVGNLGWRGAISEGGQSHVVSFWEYGAFLANSFVFILIGGHEAHVPLTAIGSAAAIAILVSLIGRAVAIYPLSWLFSRSSVRISDRLSACAVLGRTSRRAGARSGACATAEPRGAARNHRCGVCSRRLFNFRARIDDAVDDPSARADPEVNRGLAWDALRTRGRRCPIHAPQE